MSTLCEEIFCRYRPVKRRYQASQEDNSSHNSSYTYSLSTGRLGEHGMHAVSRRLTGKPEQHGMHRTRGIHRHQEALRGS